MEFMEDIAKNSGNKAINAKTFSSQCHLRDIFCLMAAALLVVRGEKYSAELPWED
jgi:hypothetical protein